MRLQFRVGGRWKGNARSLVMRHQAVERYASHVKNDSGPEEFWESSSHATASALRM